MPYVRCPHCHLSVYSAARWSSIDRCGGCGADLPARAEELTAGWATTASPPVGRLPVERDAPAPGATFGLVSEGLGR